MDLDHLARSFSFLTPIISKLGEAVNLSDEDTQAFLQNKIINGHFSSDTFYAVMNLKRMAFTFTHGTESFFGMRELTFSYFFQQIPKPFRELFLTWGEAAYTAAFDEQMKKTVQPLKQEFRTMIPIRNRAGKDYWVTQIAIPLQFDANHNLISHLNIYRVGLAYEEWDNWTMKGEVFDKHLPQNDLAMKMVDYFQKYLLSVFGAKKLEILKLYARGKSTQEVASLLNISTATVYTHNKDILTKVNRLFFREYATAKEAALSLVENEYLIIDN